MPAQPPLHPDGTPVQLGRYRLVRPISSGGMARVFEGRREGLAGVSPRVAVKVILPDFAADPAFHDLFINEARIGSLVRHQNLVQIQDFDQDNGRYYLVMEYVDGLTLRRVLGLCRKHGVPLPLSVVAELGRQAADGLHHLHNVRDDQGQLLGLVHRDIKPSNLMVDPEGVLKILDYGVSRALATHTGDGEVRGTWGYMSPEHAAGDAAGPTSDLFGLAACLFELAALVPLFPESKPDEIKALLADDEAARRVMRLKADPEHAALVPVLVRALQRDPAARYRSAADLGRALGLLVGDPVLARERLVSTLKTLASLAKPPAPGVEGDPRARSKSSRSKGRKRTSEKVTATAASAVQTWAGYGLLLVAAAIVAFTAWKLVSGPAMPAAPAVGASSGTRPVAVLAAVEPALVSASVGAAPTEARRRAGEGRETVSAAVVSVPQAGSPAAGAPPVAVSAKVVAASSVEETTGSAAPATGPTASVAAIGASSAGAGAASVRPASVATASATPANAETASPAPEAPASPPAVEVRPLGAASLVAEGAGLLTVSALTRSKVYVDGAYVRHTPLFQHELPAGTHTITLEADDGRRATFPIDVPPGGEARRVWDFDLPGGG